MNQQGMAFEIRGFERGECSASLPRFSHHVPSTRAPSSAVSEAAAGRHRLDLNEWLTAREADYRTLVGADIEFGLRLAPQVLALGTHGDSLEQQLLNLLLNAREALSNGGRIEIATAEISLREAAAQTPRRYVMFAVTDNGRGMTEQERSRALQPDFSRRRRRGSGLGLSVVARAVRRLGGFVKVASWPGAGTTVRVFLPTAEG